MNTANNENRMEKPVSMHKNNGALPRSIGHSGLVSPNPSSGVPAFFNIGQLPQTQEEISGAEGGLAAAGSRTGAGAHLSPASVLPSFAVKIGRKTFDASGLAGLRDLLADLAGRYPAGTRYQVRCTNWEDIAAAGVAP